MTHNNRVVVIEDDPFSRDMLIKLLARDWRTRVVGQFDSFSKKTFQDFLGDPLNNVDTVILDTEVPWNQRWPIEAFETINQLDKPPKLIFLCTVPVQRYWNDVLLDYGFYGGYLVKQEVMYSIAAAVKLVEGGRIVITDSVLNLKAPVHLRENMVVIDGTKTLQEFTPREIEVLRLGILFNHSQRDISDELVISRDWISEVFGSIYEKLSIKEILSGEIPLETVFPDKALLARAKGILPKRIPSTTSGSLRRVSWLGTLAFHLITKPETREIF